MRTEKLLIQSPKTRKWTRWRRMTPKSLTTFLRRVDLKLRTKLQSRAAKGASQVNQKNYQKSKKQWLAVKKHLRDQRWVIGHLKNNKAEKNHHYVSLVSKIKNLGDNMWLDQGLLSIVQSRRIYWSQESTNLFTQFQNLWALFWSQQNWRAVLLSSKHLQAHRLLLLLLPQIQLSKRKFSKLKAFILWRNSGSDKSKVSTTLLSIQQKIQSWWIVSPFLCWDLYPMSLKKRSTFFHLVSLLQSEATRDICNQSYHFFYHDFADIHS